MKDNEIFCPKEESIQLIEYDTTSKNLHFSPKGEKFLNSIQAPFGLISISGAPKSGKSFLMNRGLLNQKKGFNVGNYNLGTKGIYIWTKPIMSVNNEGNKFPVYFIDCEGVNEENDYSKIYSLLMLISSLTIYNTLGPIEENTINSMNFLLNLTKHLQVKSSIDTERNLCDDISNLMPSYIWVMRDCLKLSDENGDFVSPKVFNIYYQDYMENILDIKGKYLNEYEQKNRIKSALKLYFKDRDCFTIPKPTVSDTQLQIIDILENENLRQEFVNQIQSFRKKIFSKVKEKTLKGKKINGEILSFLIKSYIQSVNSGYAMMFESVLTQINKNECFQLFQDPDKTYDKYFYDKINFEEISNDKFKEFHEINKEKSMEIYKKRAWDADISNEFDVIPKRHIREKLINFPVKTNEEIKSSLTSFLEKWISSIDNKLKSKEIQKISEIEKEFDQIEIKVNEAYSNFIQKNEFLFFYKYKALFNSSEHIIENNNRELISVNKNYEETLNKISTEKMQMQVNYEKKLSKLIGSMQSLKNENTDLLSQNKNLKDNYKYLKEEKETMIKSLNEKLNETKNENVKFIHEIENKNFTIEEKSKEIFKKYLKENCDLISEKKLLEQKLEQLTNQIDDTCKRERDNSNDFKLQIKEQANAMREQSNRFEEQINQLKKKNEEDKDRILDLESLLNNNEFLSQNENSKNQIKISKLEKELNEITEKNKLLVSEIEKEKEIYNNKIKATENDLIKKNKQFMSTIDELETKLKTSEEKSKHTTDFQQKENAIMKQNNQLLESQVDDLKIQLHEQKIFNDNIMTKLGKNNEEEYNHRVEELKNEFSNDKKALTEEYEKSKKNFLNQLATINNKLTIQESSIDKERSMHVKEYSKLKESYDKLKKEFETSIHINKAHAESVNLTTDELNQKYKSIIRDYEAKIDDQEMRFQKTIIEIGEENEESINQLKRLLEEDKRRFEEKLQNDQENYESKIKKIIIDYETKISEKENEYQNMFEGLQNDLNEQTSNFNQYESNAEQQITSLKHKIESLENLLNETKDNYSKLQENSNYHLGNHLENMKKERNEFINKVEALSSDLNAKIKENINLGLKINKLENIIKDNDEKKEHSIKTLEIEKRDLQEKLDLYKMKGEETNEELMVKKIEFSRDNALMKQQIEFLEKKNESLQSLILENQKNYEERLFNLRTEIEKSYQDKIDKLNVEKDIIENKINQKKKEIRDIQTSNLKATSSLEKEKAILLEKISNLEKINKEINLNSEKEAEKLNNNILYLKEEMQLNNEKLLKEIEHQKSKVIALDYENKEKLNIIDKERVLFESKYKFLESQKEIAKKEFNDYQNKFESSLESLQKKAISEKEKYENSFKTSLITLKTKYQNEIREMSENHQKLYSELMNLNKEIDDEFSNINIYFDNQEKIKNEINNIQEKLIEIIEINDKLKYELERTKNDRDQKLNEIIVSFTSEKEALKGKLLDLIEKNAEFERKKGKSMIEQEREKTKYFLDKEKYESQIRTLLEEIDKIEVKNQILLKENDRLRTDKNDLLINNYSYKRISTYLKSNLANSSTGFETRYKKSSNEKTLTPGRNNMKSTTSSPKQRLDRSSNFERSPEYNNDERLKRSFGNK